MRTAEFPEGPGSVAPIPIVILYPRPWLWVVALALGGQCRLTPVIYKPGSNLQIFREAKQEARGHDNIHPPT